MSTSTITTFCERADGTHARAFKYDGCKITVEAPVDNDAAGKRAAEEIATAMGVLPRPKPFAPVRVRPLANGRLFACNKADDGFASFGYEYDSWRDLFCAWDVRPTAVGEDRFGPYVEVSP